MPVLIFFMLLSAKGAAFTRLLARVEPFDAVSDPHLKSILDSIGQAGAPIGGGETLGEETTEFVLAAIDDTLAHEGRTPAERSANLQRKFDKKLRARLLRRAAVGDQHPPMLDEAAELLDPSTVLLTVYAGRSARQEMMVWASTLTHTQKVS